MKTAFAVWSIDKDEHIDELIKELESMKWKQFIYMFWENTQENRSSAIDILMGLDKEENTDLVDEDIKECIDDALQWNVVFT